MKKLRFITIIWLLSVQARAANPCPGDMKKAVLTAQAHKASVELDVTKNEAFRPLITAFVESLEKNSDSAIKKLAENAKEKIIGPIVNLSTVMDESHADPKYHGDYGTGRYFYFEETLPQEIRSKLDSNEVLKEMVQSTISLYGFQFAGKVPENPALKKASRVVIVLPTVERGDLMNLLALLVGAVGEYGGSLQRKLALTATIMMDLVFSDEVTKKAVDLAPKFSAFPFARKMDREVEEFGTPSQLTLYEGISSVYQALTFLTSSKVEGLTGTALIRKLIVPLESDGNGLLSIFSRYIPAGFLGPRAQFGEYFPDPLTRYPNGALMPNPRLKDLIVNLHSQNIVTKNKNIKESNVTCQGCPVARPGPDGVKKSSLQMVADVFLRIFEVIDRNPDL